MLATHRNGVYCSKLKIAFDLDNIYFGNHVSIIIIIELYLLRDGVINVLTTASPHERTRAYRSTARRLHVNCQRVISQLRAQRTTRTPREDVDRFGTARNRSTSFTERSSRGKNEDRETRLQLRAAATPTRRRFPASSSLRRRSIARRSSARG